MMQRWYENREKLLEQLATATQRAETAEANARQWESTAREYSRVQEHTKKRAEAAEAQLALVERYGADQWRRGNAGEDPQEFEEWRRDSARE